MKQVLTDDLTKEFNWQGRGDKRPFSQLAILIDVIRGTVNSLLHEHFPHSKRVCILLSLCFVCISKLNQLINSVMSANLILECTRAVMSMNDYHSTCFQFILRVSYFRSCIKTRCNEGRLWNWNKKIYMAMNWSNWSEEM